MRRECSARSITCDQALFFWKGKEGVIAGYARGVRSHDSLTPTSLAEFFSDLAGSLFAGYTFLFRLGHHPLTERKEPALLTLAQQKSSWGRELLPISLAVCKYFYYKPVAGLALTVEFYFFLLTVKKIYNS